MPADCFYCNADIPHGVTHCPMCAWPVQGIDYPFHDIEGRPE